MATKTTLTLHGAPYIKTTKSLWIIDNQSDSAALETAAIGHVVAELSDGTNVTPIHTWTQRNETGDWDSVLDPAVVNCTAQIKLIVAFSPVGLVKTGTQKFVDAVKMEMEARGIFVEIINLPQGTTLTKIATDGGAVYREEYLLDRITKAIEEDEKKKKTSNVTLLETDADILFEIAHDKFSFYRSEKDEPFLVLKEGPQYAWPVMEGTPNLGEYLVEEFLDQQKKVVSSSDVRDALNAIKARCSRRGTPRFPLSLRSAQSNYTGTYWVDLGREDGKVVKLTENGWTVEDRPDYDVFFKRTSSIHELPIPVAPQIGSEKEVLRDKLSPFVNVDETDWSLLVSWMVAHLIPTYIPPIAILLSSADAGKSTATMAVRYAVEGKMVKGKNMAGDDRDMAVTMAAERVTIFNNVSHVSKKQSDFLCDVIDRTEYEARTLRTNSGITTLDIDSAILMNGITTGDLKGDFKTRAVVLELKPISGGRKSDNEIKQALRSAHPQILGALFNMAARVLSRAPHQIPDQSLNLRLVDYVRTVMAVDELWELHGQGIQRYVHALKSMASTAVDDLMFKVVHELAVKECYWNGTGYEFKILADQLRTYLNDAKSNEYVRSLGNNKRGIWETGAAVTASIRKVEPDWKRMGVTYESLGQQRLDGKKGTVLKFVFTPAEDTAWPLHFEKVPTSIISSYMPTS